MTVALDVGDAERLSHDDQVCLFQIMREAMTNALKHAGPTRIEVSVQGSPGRGIEARVADDGSGVMRPPTTACPITAWLRCRSGRRS